MADVGSSTADETLWLDVRAVSDFSAYRRPCPLAVWEPGTSSRGPACPGEPRRLRRSAEISIRAADQGHTDGLRPRLFLSMTTGAVGLRDVGRLNDISGAGDGRQIGDLARHSFELEVGNLSPDGRSSCLAGQSCRGCRSLWREWCRQLDW